MRPGMDRSNIRLLRLLAVNAAVGATLGLLMLGGLLTLDTSGLRHLIAADHSPLVPLTMLGCSLVITFGGAAMVTAIMGLGNTEAHRDPRGGELIPLRVVGRKHP